MKNNRIEVVGLFARPKVNRGPLDRLKIFEWSIINNIINVYYKIINIFSRIRYHIYYYNNYLDNSNMSKSNRLYMSNIEVSTTED